MILLSAYCLTVASVVLAYWIAGPIWVQRHSIHFERNGQQQRISGLYGELLIVSFAAAILWLIDANSPLVTIEGTIQKWAQPLLALLVFTIVGIYTHGYRTAFNGADGERLRLFLTYTVYGPFGVVLFVGGAVLVLIVVEQFLAETSLFVRDVDPIIRRLGNLANAAASEREQAIGLSYLDLEQLIKRVEQSMSPVFVFAIAVFAINLAIRYTPLKALYLVNAVRITHISTLSVVIAVLFFGGWIYVSYYSNFIDQYLVALEQLRPVIGQSSPEFVARYTEIYLSVTQDKSPLGFISRLSNDWSGLVFVLGLFQWLFEQMKHRNQ